MQWFKTTMLAAVAFASVAGAAKADIYSGSFAVTATEGLTGPNGFDTANGNPFSGPNTASAAFTYTGPLSFTNNASQNNPPKGDLNSTFGFTAANITNGSGSGTVTYKGTQVANFNSLAGFLASSASASGYAYGTYFTFDLGVLAAGTTLTITHDDGVSLFQGGTRIGSTVSGPTSVTTDTVTLASTGDTILRYARENGTPSILTTDVPEPASLTLLGLGLVGAGLARRKARRAVAA